MKIPCCICSQLRGDSTNDLLSTKLDASGAYVRRVLYDTPDLSTIPSLGGLGDAHLLICPRHHTARFAGTTIGGDVLESYLARVISSLREVIDAPTVHVFEHGNPSDGSHTVCSVEHAHLHVVASRADVWTDLRGLASWQEIPGDLSSIGDYTADSEYLFYRSPCGVSSVALPKEGGVFESQLIRRVFAEAAGHPDAWNWREKPDLNSLESLFVALAQRDATRVA